MGSNVSEIKGDAVEIPPNVVTVVAAITGVPIIDDGMAQRIAAGATAAVTAVRRAALSVASDPLLADNLFDREPAEYLAVLESLAESPEAQS